jgi:hypothetical protein
VIALWCCVVVSAGAVVRYGARLLGQTSPVSWPTETPLNAHDNRARDPHLARLTRLLRAGPTAEAQAELRAVIETLLHDRVDVVDRVPEPERGERERLGDVLAFLERPPTPDPERYRHELARVLSRVEAALVEP